MRRALPALLVGVMPAFLLFAGVARFMLNHFFVHAPYLLDTGMLSGLVYRDGLWLPMRKITCEYVNSYYDVYFSPLTSLFSLVSYVVPVDRINWYVFVQALIYVPISLAVFIATLRLDPSSRLRRLPLTIAASLAFTFSGYVLWMVPYPHLEAASPGLICLVLAAVVTGRTKLAWVCLVLVCSVRQDGGIHLAVALSPLVLLRWRGVAMPPSRRNLLAMCGAAVGASVIGMLSIKLFFTPYPRLAQAYLGSPLYSHLSGDLLLARLQYFASHNQLIYYPLLATCFIAAVRRDTGYLLGWASLVPWFVFCFLAREESKSGFVAYGVGPFMIGVFWIYLYGAYLAPAPRRLRAGVLDTLFALVCIASTIGCYRAAPKDTKIIARDMALTRRMDRDAVRAYIAAFRDHRDRFGQQLRVDESVATLAMEHLANDWNQERWAAGRTADAMAFHRRSISQETIMAGLAVNGLDYCANVVNTGLLVCTRDRLPADTFGGFPFDVLPSGFAFFAIKRADRHIVSFDQRGVVFRQPFAISAYFGQFPFGTYEWTMTLENEDLPSDEPLARVEVAQGERVMSTTVHRGDKTLALRIDAGGGPVSLFVRFETFSTTPLVITSSRLRQKP